MNKKEMSVSVASGCRVFNYILLNCICTDRRMIKLNGNIYNTDSRVGMYDWKSQMWMAAKLGMHVCAFAPRTNDKRWAIACTKGNICLTSCSLLPFFETVTTIVVRSVCFHHYQFRLMLCVGLILKFYYTFLLPFAISFTLQFCVPFFNFCCF